MRCATHPEIETSLSCGRCGKPICPKCLVQTPVGARCRECARLYKLPTYRVSKVHYLRALGVAIGGGILGGLLWWLLDAFLPVYLGLILAPAIGYALAEIIGLSVNRKRGKGLAVIAAVGVVISFLVTILLGHFPFGLFNLALEFLALTLGIVVAVNRLL